MADAIVLLIGFIFFWHIFGIIFAPVPPKKEPPCKCGSKTGTKVKDLAFFLEVCDMAEPKKS